MQGVEYQNMQTVVSDSSWTYMGKFQQAVNINQSAVQIPIEIFDGGTWRYPKQKRNVSVC